MPRGGWRFFAQQLTGDGGDGPILDHDVPLKGVQITDVLSGHNSLTGTLSPEYVRLMDRRGVPLFDEWSTALWAENQGQIWGGLLSHSSFDGPVWNLECIGFTGYWVDMPYTGAWFGVEVDPLDVVRKIYADVQAIPGSNLGLETSPLKTGLKIGTKLEQVEFDTQSGPVAFEAGPVKLAWYQTHDLAGDVNRLANETPFDFHERHFRDGDVIRHRLDFGYPQLGRRRNNRFVVGENVSRIPTITRSGEDFASEVLVLGAGEGRKMVRGSAQRRTKKLRRVAVVTDPSIRSVRAANARAERELAWRIGLDDVTDIYVRDSPHARVGGVNVGDEIYVQGDLGWKTLETWVRVLSKTLVPDEGAGMQLTVARTDRLAA